MFCSLLAGLALAPGGFAAKADETFRVYGNPADFPAVMREALTTFLEVESAYNGKNYRQAKTALGKFWAKYPVATEAWRKEYRTAWDATQKTGINIGHPGCYYSLRMYDECVSWRLANPSAEKPKQTAVLTVVLVGNSRGPQPSSKTELDAGKGQVVGNSLVPELQDPKGKIVRDSLRLFQEYILAASRGKLAVKPQIVWLKDVTVPTKVEGRFAGLAEGGMELIWKALPKATRANSDWWWVLYPSHVPEQHADFERTEFITGGMGGGPDGLSPCFISDDKWLVRKPPHLGHSPYTDVERRAYLPQWLQHEFFHHIFRTWPEFELEAKDHQWFDRTTWPPDFVGFLEPDYYAEALHKRIQPKAEPPMQVALLYAPPSPQLYRKFRVADVVGKYRHRPTLNDWHIGEVVQEGNKVYWTNKAGERWSLEPDLANGVLRTGPDCAYTGEGATEGPAFHLAFRRDAKGRYKAELAGLSFNGGLYVKE